MDFDFTPEHEAFRAVVRESARDKPMARRARAALAAAEPR
jgi:hypothetical protein